MSAHLRRVFRAPQSLSRSACRRTAFGLSPSPLLLALLLGVLRGAQAAGAEATGEDDGPLRLALAPGLATTEAPRSDPAGPIRLARAGQLDAALQGFDQQLARNPDDPAALGDKAVVLGWAGRDRDAVDLLPLIDRLAAPPYVLESLAKSARNLGRYALAAALYGEARRRAPESLQTLIGAAMTLADQGRPADGLALLDTLAPARAQSVEVQIARGYCQERAIAYGAALESYDRALRLRPDHVQARRLRALVLARLGAGQLAETALPAGDVNLEDLAFTHAEGSATQVRWGEGRPLNAASRFTETDRGLDWLARTPALGTAVLPREFQLRHDHDQVLALHDRLRMQEAVDAYQALAAQGAPIPDYVRGAAADAWLQLGAPRTALAHYREITATHPDNFDARIGVVYALLDLGEYRTAFAEIDALDAQAQAYRQRRPSVLAVTPAEAVTAARLAALARAYADMPAEASRRLSPLLARAPFNSDLMVAAADIDRARGWPRQALGEYDEVLQGVAPTDLGARTGHAYALMALQRWPTAATEIDALAAEQPEQPEVRRLVRDWSLQRAARWVVRAEATNNSGSALGAHDRVLESQLYSPMLAWDWRVFAHWRDETSAYDAVEPGFVHHGVGVAWASGDLDVSVEATRGQWSGGSSVSSDWAARWRWSDQWSLSAGWSGSSTDVPLKARALGIDGRTSQIALDWTQSESRSAALAVSLADFSDGNRRSQAALTASQRLWTTPEQQLTLSGELATSRNSLDQRTYFNPAGDRTVSVTLGDRWHLQPAFALSFDQRLALTLGRYAEDGFGSRGLAALSYEHDWSFTPRVDLLYGVRHGVRAFDGNGERFTTFYGVLNVLF